ncbi:MAG: asparagine synthase (glutamine-hydrolyzing) [Phycisphaera sp.]|nr:MAG: asparagine synthase (glutamine-hydrolyzing) [Phycisphaera sp.]
MCGIAGIIRIHDPKDGAPPTHPDAIPEAWLDTLDKSIKHRGPDGAGRFRDRATRDDGTIVDVALVHRRLSIIDHEGGHQPMVHDGKRLRPDLTYQPGETPIVASEIEPDLPLVAVVFNGCIYNHRELRRGLEAKGHVFETDHSDTEVLVHGWREWDVATSDHVDGMHAVIAWDRATGQIGTGRDLAGEKPLVMRYLHDKAIIRLFSSTASGLILNDPHEPFSVSGKPIDELSYLLRTGSSNTYLNDVFPEYRGSWSLRPPIPHRNARKPDSRIAHKYLLRQSSSHHQHRINRGTRPRLSSLGRTDRIIVNAVTSRLEADVPLGIFLSGGIDSGLIAAIAKEHQSDINTFTVRMPDKQFDESEAAAETAKHLGTDHHTLECDPHPAEDLVHLIQQLGLPFGDSSLLPTYWVSKAAREHVKVALAGDGGDELFGGYRRHTIAPKLNRYHRLLKLIPSSLLDRRTPGSRGDYLARLANAAKHGGYPELLAIFQTPDLTELICEPVRSHYTTNTDPLRYDFDNYLPNDLLRKTDTASMAVGLEVRAPFLARELVEAALRTPLDILMPKGERKGLLKQVARRYLPDRIVDRPKQGFAIPIGEWFRTDYGSMRTLLYDHLVSRDPFPGLAEAGVSINMGFVRRMLREHDAAGEKSINPWHGRDHSQRLYMLLVLSIWAKWLKSIS